MNSITQACQPKNIHCWNKKKWCSLQTQCALAISAPMCPPIIRSTCSVYSIIFCREAHAMWTCSCTCAWFSAWKPSWMAFGKHSYYSFFLHMGYIIMSNFKAQCWMVFQLHICDLVTWDFELKLDLRYYLASVWPALESLVCLWFMIIFFTDLRLDSWQRFCLLTLYLEAYSLLSLL